MFVSDASPEPMSKVEILDRALRREDLLRMNMNHLVKSRELKVGVLWRNSSEGRSILHEGTLIRTMSTNPSPEPVRVLVKRILMRVGGTFEVLAKVRDVLGSLLVTKVRSPLRRTLRENCEYGRT